jgi:hypothetical protein
MSAPAVATPVPPPPAAAARQEACGAAEACAHAGAEYSLREAAGAAALAAAEQRASVQQHTLQARAFFHEDVVSFKGARHCLRGGAGWGETCRVHPCFEPRLLASEARSTCGASGQRTLAASGHRMPAKAHRSTSMQRGGQTSRRKSRPLQKLRLALLQAAEARADAGEAEAARLRTALAAAEARAAVRAPSPGASVRSESELASLPPICGSPGAAAGAPWGGAALEREASLADMRLQVPGAEPHQAPSCSALHACPGVFPVGFRRAGHGCRRPRSAALAGSLRAQDAELAASGERARLTAALGAMRAEMEAAAAIVARERRDAAAERADARRQIRRLAEQNGALLELSNALHAGLDARARAPPDRASAPAAPRAPVDCPAGALVAARLDRLEAALAERPACAETGAALHPGVDDPGGGAPALQPQRGNAAEAPAQAGAAARPSPGVRGLLVEGCEAQLTTTAPRRTVILQVTVRPVAAWNAAALAPACLPEPVWQL